MRTVKEAERNIQQPQVHIFVSFRPRAQFLACFLQFDHTCASELDFMLSAYLFQLPLLLPHHPPVGMYHTMLTQLHQWCPTLCLGLPCFSTLTTLSNYEK